MTSREYAASIRARIDDSTTHNVSYYDPTFDYEPDHGTTHLNVLARDGAAVAMTSTINFLSVFVTSLLLFLCYNFSPSVVKIARAKT